MANDVANGKYNFINYLTARQGVTKFLKELNKRYPDGVKLAIFSLNEAGFFDSTAAFPNKAVPNAVASFRLVRYTLDDG